MTQIDPMLAQDKETKFSIKIIQHAEPFGVGYPRWWYWNKIGQEYEAWVDTKRSELYYVNDNDRGLSRTKHVRKTDCEVKPK